MTTTENFTAEQKALLVLTLTVNTRGWLAINDPKALKQADEACRAFDADYSTRLENVRENALSDLKGMHAIGESMQEDADELARQERDLVERKSRLGKHIAKFDADYELIAAVAA